MHDHQLHNLTKMVSDIAREIREIRAQLDATSKPLYLVEEFGKLTGRAPYTVRNWIKAGRIEAIRIKGSGPKGRLLIPRTELEKVIESGLGAKLPDVLG